MLQTSMKIHKRIVYSGELTVSGSEPPKPDNICFTLCHWAFLLTFSQVNIDDSALHSCSNDEFKAIKSRINTQC